MKLLKLILKKIKNKFFPKKDLFEELTSYKKDEVKEYDKEVFDWFYGSI